MRIFAGLAADETARHRAEERERVERRDIRIAAVLFVHASHRIGVAAMTGFRIAVAEENVGGGNQRAFGRSGGLRGARSGRLTETREHAASCGDVLFAPKGLVIRHRLAPVGHREGGIDGLGLPERLVRILVLEQVERDEAAFVRESCVGRLRDRAGGRRPPEHTRGERAVSEDEPSTHHDRSVVFVNILCGFSLG